MSFAQYTQALKEARRDALVSHYLATHDFGNYQGKITTADDLYEYLLLDTKISDNVTTSPLSEAVNSLQLCIHRAMEGYDGELENNNQVNAWFASDAFLDNWDRYNKRYSTWAGKEKLRFYTGNYVEPSLRTNKTQLFKELENNVNQGKLASPLVATAIERYISSYDRYANINHLWAGQDYVNKTQLYLTGEGEGQYYWRKLSLDDTNKPCHWGEWKTLPSAIKDPLGNKVIMVNTLNSGVLCEWRSMEKEASSSNSNDVKEVNVLNRWSLNPAGEWNRVFTDALEIVEHGWTDFCEDENHTSELTRTNKLSYSFKIAHYLLNSFTRSIKGAFSHNPITKEFTIAPEVYIGIFTPPMKIFTTNGIIEVEAGDTKTILFSELMYFTWRCPNPNIDCDYYFFYPFNLDAGNYPIENGELVYNGEVINVLAPDLGFPLGTLLDNGVVNLLGYDTQKTIAENGAWYHGGERVGDAFSGPYGLYLWEIFFHIPYLVATRFAAEQRFEEAERWYKYIFNSAGYRDEDGKVLMGEDGKTPRYWDCYPLQQDSAWDALVNMPASTDPDIIAMADPMHYKLSIFLHTLDLLIARGDAAYRMLERDTLTEAKMFYIQAQQLLEPRPEIRITNTWDNPTLEKEAGSINKPATCDDMPQTFAQWLRAGDRNEMGDGNFLPPYNDVLLTYWDKIDVRLFNLRHNLSLTGQPLDLPLFATPAEPAELHRQQSGGDGVQGDASPANNIDTGWRYPLLADHARNAASQLTQFGGGLLSALERRDSEQLTQLLQTQQISVLNQQQDIAQKNLDSLSASLTSLNTSLASAQIRKHHYTHLIDGNLSAQEQAGLTLRTTARGLTIASQGLTIAGGALSALPNTFGLANGGGDFGAPIRAAGLIMQAAATADEQSAVISDISAGYLRRSEEWRLQCDLADKDVEQMNAQIDSLKAQIAMQQKQMLLIETESANAQAVYDLQSSRFTGQALYNWMVSRLSGLYYQLYDATVPVCLQARNALRREFGNDKADGLFRGAVWNDLYQGLLAGEGLTTELQKLNNVWLQHSALGLEATRTVSLAALRGEESGSLSTVIGKLLLGTEDGASLGKLQLKSGVFSAVLDLSKLGLDSAYNDTTRRRFIKSISVTLPTLLGPYQDIEATLSGSGQMATLSHGMQDAGRFVTNFDDSRFLPFEGMELKKDVANPLTLSIFNVKGAYEAVPNQRAIVENLSDIVFHIHYIMR